LNKTKILIVEDEYIIAQDIKRSLLSENYTVVGIAASGTEAFDLIEEKKPDLILMDIMLQDDINGLVIANKVDKEYKIPVIFLTGFANDSILQEAINSNPFGYILKPFEDRELHAAIKMALYKSAMERKLRESKEFLWHVIDSVPDYIFVKDSLGKYVLVNKALAGMFGEDPKDIVGKTDADLLMKAKIDCNVFKTIFSNRESTNNGKMLSNITQKLSLIEDDEKWLQVSQIPLRDKHYKGGEILGVAVDITNIKKTEILLKESVEKMKRLLEQTVQGLVLAVEIRDPYTAGHQKRVAKLAVEVGKKLGFSSDRLHGLRIAASIHDIGKIYVPAEILNKPGKISQVEFNLIKMHPQNGYDILKNIEFPWPVAEIVYQHHEKNDGTGYPRGLKENEILMEAKILGVADIVESMSSHRPYRPSLGIDAALEEIIKGKDTTHDNKIVDICVALFREENFQF
jgi:PAS domain S-box-containing protein/putative nucleotidyltransferase with HDIG domain